MSHKADASFFDEKREWSKKKDRILDHYLVPYFTKLKNLRKPIHIVDAFAGPGKYKSGERGSPLIICDQAQEAIQKYGAKIEVLCIELDTQLHALLETNLASYPFARAEQGSFADYVDEIVARAEQGTTIFLYLDPYTPTALDLFALERIFRHIDASGSSVELLLNFMGPTFRRMAWQLLKEQRPEIPAPEVAELSESDEFDEDETSEQGLDAMVGGDWWKELLSTTPASEQLTRLMDGLKSQLHTHFNYVCFAPVLKGEYGSHPVYFLVFGSRHEDALKLMNDEMIEACNLSELSNLPLIADQELEDRILSHCGSTWIARGEVITKMVAEHFCQYSTSDIKKRITDLIKLRLLESENGKSRISDDIRIRNPRPSP